MNRIYRYVDIRETGFPMCSVNATYSEGVPSLM